MTSAARKTMIEVSAAVIVRDEMVLLTSRDDHGDRRYWEFPGGKRELGESFAACLCRELREELGVRIRVYDVIYCIEHEYPSRTVDIRFFRCSLEDHALAIEPREGQEFRWVSLHELDLADLLPADAPLADFLRRQYYS